jgi:hypothetical protein
VGIVAALARKSDHLLEGDLEAKYSAQADGDVAVLLASSSASGGHRA